MKKYLPFQILFFFLFVISCSSDSGDPAPEPEPDVIAPTVTVQIAGSTNNTTGEPSVFSNQITINISAQDAGGVAKVEAFINNQKVGEDNSAPFQLTIDLSNYSSKIPSTGKFQDYILKIVATDTSGNEGVSEQIIHIDNELPAIANVSLSNASIINGDTNAVTFEVSDNEGLTSVKTFLNNELLQEITDEVFEININTLDLNDGNNVFKIEAVDLAQNTTNYEVNFIADNTGPEITLEAITEGSVLDTLFLMEPKVEDLFSEVTSFKISLNDALLHESTEAGQKSIEINPNDFEIGDATFKLTATDNLNNETVLQINTTVLRRLFTVQIDEGFLESSWRSFWILVSEMDGSPITYHFAQLNEENIVLHAPTEFPMDKEFMVSFIADEDHLSWVDTHMTTIQNLTRENFNSIHFTPPFGSTYSVKNVPAINFEATDDTQAQGRNFQIYHESSQQAIRVVQYQGYEQYFPNNAYLIGYQLSENTPYSYLKIGDPWNTDFTVNKNDFTTNLVKTGVIDMGNIVGAYNPSLEIFGYETDEDFENDAYHRIYMNQGQQEYGNQFAYYYPEVFNKYKHHFRVKQYNTIREGKPLTSYNVPDWIPSFTQNNSEIVINNSGIGHTVGRLFLTYGKSDGGYQNFSLIYDSSKNQTLYVPQLPEAMSALSIYDAFKNELFEVDFADLSSFDNIQSYDEYIELVIKPYKEHYETSKITDNIVDGNLFAILANWSFKYD